MNSNNISKLLFFFLAITTHLAITTQMFSQKINLTGKVFDSRTKKGLSFAYIRLVKKNTGTSANKEGNYRLNLTPNYYKIVASYIGYNPDTIKINLKQNKKLNFYLKQNTEKISTSPITNKKKFVYQIIKNAIETKRKNKEKTKTYKYSAYTKGLVKTTGYFDRAKKTFKERNRKLKITGIMQNESRVFYKTPDKKKLFIVGYKQTKNIPPFINAITSGMEIQNFYEEEIEFMGRYIPSPISKRALKYYGFNLISIIETGNKKIFKIGFDVVNPSTIGLYGNLYIEDGTYILRKANAFLNSAANPGGFFDYVKIFQRFSAFDNIILPVDYHLIAKGDYLGLAKFGFELHSVIYNYEINKPIDDNIFNRKISTVFPDANRKDEYYWKNIEAIPSTAEELNAYAKLDSIANMNKTNLILFIKNKIKLNNNFSVTAPLSIYNFNKVEGSNLGLGVFYYNNNSKRLSGNVKLFYGFADKKLKKELNINYLAGTYRTSAIKFNAFDKIAILFKNSDNYNRFTSTWLSLLTKYDFRNYYYTKGFTFNISGYVLPFLNLGFGFLNCTDRSAINNSDFSFFYGNKKYTQNIPVYDSKTTALTLSFKLDFREFTEDGFFIKRITPPNFILFKGNTIIASKKLFKSENDFRIYNLEAYGRIHTFGRALLNFDIQNIFSKGAVPFQRMQALSGNINIAGKNNSFRTLRLGEVFGDKVTAIFLTYNFNDELFKLLNIPYLKKSNIQLKTYLNIAWSDISQKSRSILPVPYKTFKKPFYEIGFSIGHILFPATLEFTWKLNYRGHNNFVVGINTFVL